MYILYLGTICIISHILLILYVTFQDVNKCFIYIQRSSFVMVMQRKLKIFACIIIFITCLIMSKMIFFPKNSIYNGTSTDYIQTIISSNPSLMVHSENDSLFRNLSLHEQKISPMGVNNYTTSFKDVNSHQEGVKEVNNSNKANNISKSDVHDPCNDPLCLNFLSPGYKKKFYSCQKEYERFKKKFKEKRVSNVCASCHFRDGKGKLIIRVKGKCHG